MTSVYATSLPPIETVVDGPRAAVLVQHPVRRSIVALARTPISATEIAGKLGLPRQRVNYHVRKLARARFLEPAERRLRRNMVEQRYVATARSYVIAPELLGALAPHHSAVSDGASAAALFAIASRAQADMTQVMAEAGAESRRVSTMSLTADVRFETAEQRAAFAAALESAVADVIARHSAPFTVPDGSPASGRPYRLFLGCHPIPRAPSEPPTTETTPE
ncbi:MAG TPA: winged helix-turn-helix domain-containing protein [Gemmatimonadaceae bacterium]|nr:winged helix-turn-helix domain-containing protein [Gemmatimonadaceae bacterium]